MPSRNRERVARLRDSGTQTTDAGIAEVFRANRCRIISLIIGNAFDIARAVQTGVDCDGIAARRARCVGEGVLLIIMRSGETTAGARFPSARAWPSIPSNS